MAASCWPCGIAEFERELIRKRCQAGIDRAKRKGTKFGRPAVLDASQKKRRLAATTMQAAVRVADEFSSMSDAELIRAVSRMMTATTTEAEDDEGQTIQ